MPLLVAPVAFQRLVDPDGEVAMARAAAAAGTIMCLSTIATSRPREIAARRPAAPRWFQLYCFRDRGVTRALIDEAVESGFEAIALTVDAPRAGRRERDLRTGFAVPPEVHSPGGRRRGRLRAADDASRRCSSLVDPTLDLGRLRALASECPLPVLRQGRADRRGRAARGRARRRRGDRLQPRRPPARRRPGDARHPARGGRGGRRPLRGAGRRRHPPRHRRRSSRSALGRRAVLAGRAPLWGLAVGGEDGAARARDPARGDRARRYVLLGCVRRPAERSARRARPRAAYTRRLDG